MSEITLNNLPIGTRIKFNKGYLDINGNNFFKNDIFILLNLSELNNEALNGKIFVLEKSCNNEGCVDYLHAHILEGLYKDNYFSILDDIYTCSICKKAIIKLKDVPDIQFIEDNGMCPSCEKAKLSSE